LTGQSAAQGDSQLLKTLSESGFIK
jgi:hypothetical protein